MDSPEPEWKYLSGFAIKKGAADKGAKGTLTNLLTPRRGVNDVVCDAAPPTVIDDSPINQPAGDEPSLEPFNETEDHASPIPLEEAEPPETPDQHQNTGQPEPASARQTRSGRTIRNTPRYEQSVAQRDQGLVAWEVLLDQDEQEQVPTAASQYKIQKSLENPFAFAASDNPDILYWDQAMNAPDKAQFVEAVGTELDGHEKMGNYEPIPLSQVPKGTKLIDMVWSMRRKRRIKTQEVESTSERARGTTGARCPLLGHLRPRSYVADRPPFPHSFDPAWMAKPSTRLRHGLSTGPSRDASLHEASAGLPS